MAVLAVAIIISAMVRKQTPIQRAAASAVAAG
jgi:hypothetical protein